MVNLTGSIEQAMSIILAFTDRVGIFGITLTVLIVGFVSFEWSIRIIQKVLHAVVPGLTFQADQDQAILDEVEFNHDRDDLRDEHKHYGEYDPELHAGRIHYDEQ